MAIGALFSSDTGRASCNPVFETLSELNSGVLFPRFRDRKERSGILCCHRTDVKQRRNRRLAKTLLSEQPPKTSLNRPSPFESTPSHAISLDRQKIVRQSASPRHDVQKAERLHLQLCPLFFRLRASLTSTRLNPMCDPVRDHTSANSRIGPQNHQRRSHRTPSSPGWHSRRSSLGHISSHLRFPPARSSRNPARHGIP